jgi:hypothetical protein
MEAKEAERAAQDRRRDLEDKIAAAMRVPADLDGTMRREVDGIEQDLAREAGLTDHLSALFRWKAEINAKAWERADESITKPLIGAITTKPGRPSFSIAKKEG